jgi:hypothetical protein
VLHPAFYFILHRIYVLVRLLSSEGRKNDECHGNFSAPIVWFSDDTSIIDEGKTQ